MAGHALKALAGACGGGLEVGGEPALDMGVIEAGAA